MIFYKLTRILTTVVITKSKNRELPKKLSVLIFEAIITKFLFKYKAFAELFSKSDPVPPFPRRDHSIPKRTKA